MKNLKKIIIIAIFFAISANAFAQSKDGHPTFRGSVKLPGNFKSSFDSLLITYWAPSFTGGSSAAGAIRLVTDEHGNFSFNLPKYTKPSLFRIYIRRKNQNEMIFDHRFFEPFDSIYINLFKGEGYSTAVFSGYGSEKYNIANQLDKIHKEYTDEYIKSRKVYNDLRTRLIYIEKLTRDFERKQIHLIENSGLDQKMQKLVKYENGQIYSSWVLEHHAELGWAKDDQSRQILKESFNRNRLEFSHPVDPVMDLCSVYLLELPGLLARGMEINSPVFTLESFYHILKNNYSGHIRDILLTNLFLGRRGLIKGMQFDNSSFDSLMREGEKLVVSPELKKRFHYRLRMVVGEKVFEASFIDLNGKTVSLSSLKGKVVLIDMWNIGCGFCADFHKRFKKEILPFLKDEKDFVYLSIGTDKTKEKWQDGINSGLYTSPEYLNVSTGNLSLDHPFAKFYDIQGLPFIMGMDKNGKVFFRESPDLKDLLDQIRIALKQTPFKSKENSALR
ncbi:redoxin domain-containing protein [Pedobacter hiemivivus]|uniref:Redoxin domain-containing protein n=1 Tax=Pedobacter hiemivivus TaxID=2530454 RepID=A0A4U1GDQ6_9SPHI|nr:thioredoxin-like domain-containing protein [Pedobacter hiemivivus]TKC62201.1 redoxin domain-containing protein [Pedobacter hiemivivus]